MALVNITRVMCDGCLRTVDETDDHELAWLVLTTQKGRVGRAGSDSIPPVNLDLCSGCSGHLRRRLAEIGIKL